MPAQRGAPWRHTERVHGGLQPWHGIHSGIWLVSACVCVCVLVCVCTQKLAKEVETLTKKRDELQAKVAQLATGARLLHFAYAGILHVVCRSARAVAASKDPVRMPGTACVFPCVPMSGNTMQTASVQQCVRELFVSLPRACRQGRQGLRSC